jgi:8-oxo-dGTP diphosphatase
MSTEFSRHVRVVTAVVERQGRYLITQRLSAVLPGLWQFPSGKVEPGEDDETALKREMLERVGVDVNVGQMRAHRTHYYAGYAVDHVLYEASIASNQEPRCLDVADFRWVSAEELEEYPFPPADQATTDVLFGLPRQQAAERAAMGSSPATGGMRAPRPTDSVPMSPRVS